MILYFADRAMNILGFATTHKISDISIVDDYRTEETDTGVSTLEVTVGYNKASRLKAEAMTEAGNYILFSDDDVKSVFDLMEQHYSPNKWGLINSITEIAQKFTLERRIELERIAGDMLAVA